MMDIAKAEGNWGWCSYRERIEEEFRIPEFEKILVTPMGVIAVHIGKFGRGVYKYMYL